MTNDSYNGGTTEQRQAVTAGEPFQTTTINGRDYIIIATPHC